MTTPVLIGLVAIFGGLIISALVYWLMRPPKRLQPTFSDYKYPKPNDVTDAYWKMQQRKAESERIERREALLLSSPRAPVVAAADNSGVYATTRNRRLTDDDLTPIMGASTISDVVRMVAPLTESERTILPHQHHHVEAIHVDPPSSHHDHSSHHDSSSSSCDSGGGDSGSSGD